MGLASSRLLRSIAIALAIAACAAFHWVGLTSIAGPNGDDVGYLVLGKALMSGLGYRFISSPAAPMCVSYPPVYPTLLALIWSLFPAWPANVFAFKALNIAAALTASILLYRLITGTFGGSRLTAALAAAMTATGAGVVMMMDLTMSELVYMAVVVAALAWIEPMFDKLRAPAGSLHGWRVACIAGLLVGLVMMTKTIGFTLGVAAGAWLLLQRRWSLAGLFGLTLVAANLPWLYWVSSARLTSTQPRTDYLAWAQANIGGDVVANMQVNFLTNWQTTFPFILASPLQSPRLHDALSQLGAPWLPDLAIAWFVLVACGGLILTGRERLRVYHLYVVIFLAFATWFPWHPTRYCVTLTPFLVYGLAEGCRRLWPLGQAFWPVRAVVIATLVVGLGGAPLRVGSMLAHNKAHDTLLPLTEARNLRDRHAFSTWVRANTAPEALLLHERAELAYLDTSRNGLAYMGGAQPDAATREVFATRPTYLVVFPLGDEFQTTHKALLGTLGPILPVFRGPEGLLEVYRVR